MIDRAIGVQVRNDFPSTQWKIVLDAQGEDSAGQAALGALCREYWYPIYAFIRRRVGNPHRAHDLTQDFFTRLLTRRIVARADRSRGRFRDYLLVCCRNFLRSRWRWFLSRRNGGGVTLLPLDFATADARFEADRAAAVDPERQFQRAWALAVLDRTMATLRDRYARADDADLFDRLSRTLTGDPEVQKYAEIGAAVGRTVDQVKKAACRLKEEFKTELRRQVGQTLADPADVDDEIQELFRAVGSE